MSEFLAFHIGPVQDFIATARRTQDWWMGSWLLAHLSKTAINIVKGRPGVELVLPRVPVDHPDAAIADTPNHFLARVKDSDAEQIARRVQAAVENEWARIHGKMQSEFFNGTGVNGIWKRQVENFLEIYWAVVADDGNATARNRAYAAIEARKRLRDFKSIVEPNLKCTLCGARQELSGKANRSDARKSWDALRPRHLDKKHLEKLRRRDSEWLCAVCMVKRGAVAAAAVPLDKTDASFPSTSSVAAVTFVKRLLDEGKAKSQLEEHFKVLEKKIKIARKVEINCLPGMMPLTAFLPEGASDNLIFDGDVFYEGTFTEKRIREEYPEADSKGAESGAISVRSLHRAAGGAPSKYFAALMMDGDHMGAFYGSATEEKAGELSERMSQFAWSEAGEVVTENLGRLVYAGGDDVLAMLPLETALACARDLRNKFNAAVEKVIPTEDYLPKGAMRPTPSIGIAVAHHTQPLEATLLAMQEAERQAKNTYQRNALCVHVLKRSGAEVRVGMQWKTEDDSDAVEVVTGLVDLLKKRALSMRFPTVFAAEAQFLPAGAIEAELGRLGTRQNGEQFEKYKKEVKDWLKRASKLASAIGAARLAEWTLFARFIASGGRDE